MSGFVTKAELEKILMNLDDRIDAAIGIGENMTKIFWLSSPITLSLTWDNAWHTYDFTSETSADARGVFLGVYLYRSSGDWYAGHFYTAKYNNTAWEGIVEVGGGSDGQGHLTGGTIIQGIDEQQRMNYHGGSASGTRTVKLLGYWE